MTFTDVPIAELEAFTFLGRIVGLERPPLVSATPYRPGLIPVVFVHGTDSSVVRWAEMYNRLQADQEIRSRVQFAPSIKVHSIISVDPKYWSDGSFSSAEGNDGVVAYSSAHIESVESELVVRSPHSC